MENSFGQKLYQRKPIGVGEMAQRSRTLAPLADDLSFVPSTHVGWLPTTCNSTSMGSSDYGFSHSWFNSKNPAEHSAGYQGLELSFKMWTLSHSY